jgi:hypothetical protein
MMMLCCLYGYFVGGFHSILVVETDYLPDSEVFVF